MKELKVFTIGFTKKNVEKFFTLLKESDAERIIDVRRNNTSQIAGFAKRDHLAYFLREICGTDYIHIPELAPTKPLKDAYQNGEYDWPTFKNKLLSQLCERGAEKLITPEKIENGCLLCSEHEPWHCHRSLIVQYLNKEWNGYSRLNVEHLM